MRRFILPILILLLTSCSKEVSDPYSLAPTTSYSVWTPQKGNSLISSKYCQTLLPSHFESAELSLAELLDIALQNNPLTKQTWAQARAAAAQYGESLSPFYPNITFDGTYTREKGTAGSVGLPTRFFYTQAGPDVYLSYTLFDFGQRTAAATAAREALYYADLTHNQEIQNIVQVAMDDYYNYLYQMAILRTDEADLQNAQSSLDAANEKFALGLAALGDVAQARTQFLQSKINLTTQKQNVENAFAQLATDLGLPANRRFKVQPLPDQIFADPMLESVGELVERAQSRRQDFLAAQANVRSQEANLLSAKRALLPVLGSNFDVGYYWFQKNRSERSAHWSAELTLSFPIFDGFYYRNAIRYAQANLEQSKAQMFATELTLVQQVTTAHMQVKTSAQNLSDTEEYLKAAELEFNIALTSYKAGTATILDVLSAQSSLADARSKKAGAQKDWFTALASLAYATGSLCATPCEENECAH